MIPNIEDDAWFLRDSEGKTIDGDTYRNRKAYKQVSPIGLDRDSLPKPPVGEYIIAVSQALSVLAGGLALGFVGAMLAFKAFIG